MPFHKERYPANWKEISLRIRARAGGKCEFCGAENYKPHPITGSKVVLTVAHLGIPVRLPFNLHVTGITQAHEIIKFVGFGMIFDPEGFERNDMMNNGTLSEFLGISAAMSAGFIVSLPSTTTGFLPSWSVIPNSPAAPIWVRVSSFDLLDEPFHTAFIPAEASTFGNPIPSNFVTIATDLTDSDSKRPFADTHKFPLADSRTRFPFFTRLRGSEFENSAANNAIFFSFTMTGSPTYSSAFLPHSDTAIKFDVADSRTRLSFDSVYGNLKNSSANYTGLFGGTDSWSTHNLTIPYRLDLDHNPQNCADENLKALCQRCHLRYDIEHHKKNSANTRHKKILERGQFELIPRNTPNIACSGLAPTAAQNGTSEAGGSNFNKVGRAPRG